MKYAVGDLYPVWWETPDKRPDGRYMATIISIHPYTGIYTAAFTHIFTLSAPKTKQGRLYMTVKEEVK